MSPKFFFPDVVKLNSDQVGEIPRGSVGTVLDVYNKDGDYIKEKKNSSPGEKYVYLIEFFNDNEKEFYDTVFIAEELLIPLV